ncbi:MAG: beta-eliminating lyase-related protein [Pseudomonadota bacterium]
MYFGSDNWAGAAPEVTDALRAASSGFAASYGADDLTSQLKDTLGAFFDRQVDVFCTATGSGANMLALSAITRPGGAILAHRDAHILVDEACGPESLVGMKLHKLQGRQGRISARDVLDGLAAYPDGAIYRGRVIAVSMTQATEFGTTYCVMDVAAIGSIARRNGVFLHMDGARFCNALVAQDVAPSAMTHEAGVDMLSLGFTKNGAWASEMVVSFRPDLHDDLAYRNKQMGQVFSKNRFAAAQALAMLRDDTWKRLASHANTMAADLSNGLSALPGCRLAAPTEVNEVFAIVPNTMADSLASAGAIFAPWPSDAADDGARPADDETLIRLVTSFATTQDHVDHFLEAASRSKAA